MKGIPETSKPDRGLKPQRDIILLMRKTDQNSIIRYAMAIDKSTFGADRIDATRLTSMISHQTSCDGATILVSWDVSPLQQIPICEKSTTPCLKNSIQAHGTITKYGHTNVECNKQQIAFTTIQHGPQITHSESKKPLMNESSGQSNSH